MTQTIKQIAIIEARSWSLNARIPIEIYKKNSKIPQKAIITGNIWESQSLSLPPNAIHAKNKAMIKNGKYTRE